MAERLRNPQQRFVRRPLDDDLGGAIAAVEDRRAGDPVRVGL